MARLLVMNIDNNGLEADAFKKGDIVYVAEDRHAWGRSEQPPKFQHIDVSGTAEENRYLMESELDSDNETLLLLRRYKLDLSTNKIIDKALLLNLK